MIFAGVSASQITKICITHFHGDHCLGLAGVLQRISLDRVPHTVELYYPAYGQRYVGSLRTSSIYYNTARIQECPFSEAGMIHHRYRLPLLLDGERVWMDFEEFDTTKGIVDWPEDYFEAIVRDYLTAGGGQSARVGVAESHLFKARDLRDFGIQWMEKKTLGWLAKSFRVRV